MAQATLNHVLEEIKTLESEELRQVELAVFAQRNRLVSPSTLPNIDENAWELLDQLIGTVVAPADWSEEHDHYLSGANKRSSSSQT